jgi:hypothetical protein
MCDNREFQSGGRGLHPARNARWAQAVKATCASIEGAGTIVVHYRF